MITTVNTIMKIFLLSFVFLFIFTGCSTISRDELAAEMRLFLNTNRSKMSGIY